MLEKMWNMTSGNSEMTMENFVTDGEKLLKNYTDEVIAAFQAGITAETSESSKKWHFWGAVFYCLTVYTTIGYGHIAPATDTGRIATMIYAAIGIPLCLVVLVKVGKIFTRILKLAASLTRRTCHRIYVYCRRKHEGKNDQTDGLRTDRIMSEPSLQPDLNELIDLYEQQDSSFDVPIVVALLLVIVYILIGAALYRIWERWDYTEAVYFIFISISTIGFGDVLPEHPKFFLLVSVYIFVGLSLVSMVVNVLMDNMAEKLDKAQTRIKELATKENEESSKDVTDNTGSKVAETEETPSSPPKSPERGIIKNIIEKAQISKPDHPPRVDKIDLTCLSSCTKDE